MPMLRDMQASDFAPLAAWMVVTPLWRRYGLTVERAVYQFETALARGDILLTAAGEADAPVGFAWLMPKGAFGRSPYLRLIGVQPALASQGTGALLLAAIEARAWAMADALFLLVSDFNVRAQQFYSRHGYQQAGALADYVVPGVTEFLFWKHRVAP